MSRFQRRPLLVIGAGVAVLSLAACPKEPVGNLMAPVCPDGGIDFSGTRCPETRAPAPKRMLKFGSDPEPGSGGTP